jgi:hypothetical protein
MSDVFQDVHGPAEAALQDATMLGPQSSQPLSKLSRLLDLKGLAKPVSFSGAEAEWADWKFRFLALRTLLGCAEDTQAVVKLDIEPNESVFTAEEKQRSQAIWGILAQYLHGRAYALLRLAPMGAGYTVWYRLWQEYETPDEVPRQMAVLMCLIQPTWSNRDVNNFQDKLMAWEYRMSELEATSTIRIPEAIKCAVLMTKSPKPIRSFLKMQSLEKTTSYSSLKRAIQLFLQRGLSYDEEGRQKGQELPDFREVDAVVPQGQGFPPKSGKKKGAWQNRRWGNEPAQQ